MFIDTVTYQHYLDAGGSAAVGTVANTIALISEPAQIILERYQIQMIYQSPQGPLVMTLAVAAARVSCQITLNGFGVGTLALPDDFEKIYQLLSTQLGNFTKCIENDTDLVQEDQTGQGPIFGRLYACMGALLTQLAGQPLPAICIKNAAILDAFIAEDVHYSLSPKRYLCFTVSKMGIYCITFMGAEMALSVNNQHVLQTSVIEEVLQVLEGYGLNILPYSKGPVKSTSQSQMTGTTSYFSSNASAQNSQNQGNPYKIRVTETYTRDIVLYANTTQELGAKALELTRNHPETLNEGFTKAGVTIKRLS